MSERDRADAEAAAARAASRDDGRVNGAPAAQSRGWFRLHLSTAIVLMFVASIMLWANMTVLHNGILVANSGALVDLDDLSSGQQYDTRGWPLRYQLYLTAAVAWSWRSLVVNVIIATSVLSASAIVCKYLIRRRERGRA